MLFWTHLVDDHENASPSSALTSETIHRYSFGGFHPQLEVCFQSSI